MESVLLLKDALALITFFGERMKGFFAKITTDNTVYG
jgi:hypothetical protein